jgi:two-component system phosphate regulon sensor histidine kinase PhoR
MVKADRSDLDRIFMNLISNGIKYNRENGTLSVGLKKEGGIIVATVADSGIGMSQEDIGNLFQEFFRVRNRKTSGISGTGLGLATVKRVLSEYNGRIAVQSEPDKGSTFTVYFPSDDAKHMSQE